MTLMETGSTDVMLPGVTAYTGGSLAYADDGRDWTAWLVWAMRARNRLSVCSFEPAPGRPQVSAPVVPLVRRAGRAGGRRSRTG